jgi:pyroglutamyl-peptidase
MKKLLITGFDPFGGETINPSWEAVKLLPEQIGNFVLCKLQVPTVFGLAAEKALEKAAEFQPDMILCIGQAGGRSAITPERIAVNIRDARIPDNAGNQPRGLLVAEDGPAAYFTTVPVTEMAERVATLQIPATVSNSAGAFVCNDLLYSMLHHFAGTAVRVGFIHIPYLPQQGEPSLPLETSVAALTAAIEAC